MKRLLCAVLLVSSPGWAQAPTAREELRPPSAFASIDEPAAQSRALFSEAAKVLTSPRCMNCHPNGDHPSQGNDRHVHQPPVTRGVGTCQTCHTGHNFTLHEKASHRSIPGHPRWDLAPIEMAWQGKTVGTFAVSSKTRSAMAVATWPSCRNTPQAMMWLLGAGSRSKAEIRPREHKNFLAS